jgi:hypothetical protein
MDMRKFMSSAPLRAARRPRGTMYHPPVTIAPTASTAAAVCRSQRKLASSEVSQKTPETVVIISLPRRSHQETVMRSALSSRAFIPSCDMARWISAATTSPSTVSRRRTRSKPRLVTPGSWPSFPSMSRTSSAQCSSRTSKTSRRTVASSRTR